MVKRKLQTPVCRNQVSIPSPLQTTTRQALRNLITCLVLTVLPHGAVRPFHQKSTFITQSNSGLLRKIKWLQPHANYRVNETRVAYRAVCAEFANPDPQLSHFQGFILDNFPTTREMAEKLLDVDRVPAEGTNTPPETEPLTVQTRYCPKSLQESRRV